MANKIRIVDLDGSVNADILASLLGLNVNSLYKARANGKIPDWSGGKASYADCILGYVGSLEKIARGQAGSLAEQLTEKTIQLTVTRIENLLVDIKIKRQEYGSYIEIKELIEPIFHVINSGLNNLTRRYSTNKDLVQTVDTLLETLESLGRAITEKAYKDGNEFVSTKLAEKFEGEAIDLPSLKDLYNLDNEISYE
jgi:hypothetical protein